MFLGATAIQVFLLLLSEVRPSLPPSKSESVEEQVAPPVQFATILHELGDSNSTLVTRVVLTERRICGEMCGEFYPHDGSVTRKPPCQICHCDTQCTFFHDCCPDVLLQRNVTLIYHNNSDLAECLPLMPFPLDPEDILQGDQVFMVTSCPLQPLTTWNSEFDDVISDNLGNNDNFIIVEDKNVVKMKCEKPDLTQPDQSFPVTSRRTSITYRNIYCATCHDDANDLDEWRASIFCVHAASTLVSESLTKLDLLKTLMSSDGVEATGCQLKYVPKDFQTVIRGCSAIKSEIIDTCNVTGKWDFYDELYVQACALYTSVFFGEYKNMFCFLCNTGFMSLETFRTSLGSADFGNIAQAGSSILVEFGDAPLESQELPIQESGACCKHAFRDPVTCTCRTPQCSEGKYLTSNGNCRSMLTSSMLGYHFCARVQILTATNMSEDGHQMFEQKMNSAASHIPSLWKSSYQITEWCPGEKVLTFNWEVYLRGNGLLEDIETDIDMLMQNIAFMIEPVFDTPVKSLRYKIFPCTAWSHDLHHPCRNNSDSMSTEADIFLVNHLDDLDTFNKIHFIDFLPTNRCPFLEISAEQYNIHDEGDIFVLSEFGVNITKSRVFKKNQSVALVCVSTYLSMARTFPETCVPKVDHLSTWTISGLISITCTCISLLGLLLTFVTYILLPPLRSGSGKNIMMSTVSLFMAQTFHEFTMEQYEHKTVCQVFGIIIHYTWLAALFSMNACTIERFYKLSYPLKSRSFFMTNKSFMMAVLYSLTCPLVIVALNVIANLVTRDDMGYGSPTLCYINNSISRFLAFAVPMGILVVFNIFLLLITISHLRKGPPSEAKTNSHTRVGLVACVRMSSVIGITWLSAFLYEAFPIEMLDYVFTALTGLQGVVFFCSVVINKRVFTMFHDLWSGTSGQKYDLNN